MLATIIATKSAMHRLPIAPEFSAVFLANVEEIFLRANAKIEGKMIIFAKNMLMLKMGISTFEPKRIWMT